LTEEGADAASDARGLERLLARGAKVIYLPPVPSAERYGAGLLNWGREGKVLVVSGHPELPRQGAVLWVALDYRRLGEETAALARRVLKGEAPKKIAIREATPLKVEVDEKLMRQWSGYPPPK
jgi:putative ABC transport system substrate-binding protein